MICCGKIYEDRYIMTMSAPFQMGLQRQATPHALTLRADDYEKVSLRLVALHCHDRQA